MIKNVLSIAGSDPSGGAGIQADLKTFGALGCYGMAVMTALTAQNTQGVSGIHPVPADFVRQQIEDIFNDIRVDAVKIGMVNTPDVAQVIAEMLRKFEPQHIVLDPVMVASSGDHLISDEAIEVLKSELVPQATLVTPNIPEAALLGDISGVPVLLKGGHQDGDTCVDVLIHGEERHEFTAPRIEGNNNHGTGCTLSSALACFLARGDNLQDAVAHAKSYVTGALRHADQLDVGKGCGPVNHFWNSKP